MADDGHHHEIVIIKRHHGDHDDHHGGAWKIAFADFMTAMMAFFLVMWLISANDKTRASVARYFNPVRLVDATTQPRGLHDTKKDESGITSSAPDTKEPNSKDKDKTKEGGQPKGAATEAKTETPSGKEKRLDAALRESPYTALAEIAGATGPGEVVSPSGSASAPKIGARGGEAFRDPFAPPPAPSPSDMADTASDDKMALDEKPEPAAATKPHPQKVVDAQRQTPKSDEKADKQQQDALKNEILAPVKGVGRDATGPAVEVRRTPEGLLVSLTDTADFSMFTNGSSVPSRRVILLMDHVAQVLKDKPGQIVVRGYTDNKPYHTSHYDNWRLSLDRAQVTHYMLVRGGLADARIGHIEGYADRVAMPGLDPASPLNRRIEILLKDKG